MAQVFDDNSINRIRRAVKKSESTPEFLNTNSQQVGDPRTHWLKVLSKTASSWNANQYVYTVNVYVTPFDASALHTNALMVNACEVGATNTSLFIADDTFVRPVDFLNYENQWYYVVEVASAAMMVGQYQHMVYQMITQNQAGFGFVKAHTLV